MAESSVYSVRLPLPVVEVMHERSLRLGVSQQQFMRDAIAAYSGPSVAEVQVSGLPVFSMVLTTGTLPANRTTGALSEWSPVAPGGES